MSAICCWEWIELITFSKLWIKALEFFQCKHTCYSVICALTVSKWTPCKNT